MGRRRASIRITNLARGGSWLVRHAPDVVRLGAAANRGDGWAVGTVLGRALSADTRREAAAAALAPDDVAVELQAGGFSWVIPSGDRILADMLRGELYEDAERRAVVDWVRADDVLRDRSVVVEVGANVGTTTLPLCASGYTVVALEPVARTYELLEGNVRRNGLEASVRLANVACTAEEQVVEMRVAGGGSEVVTGSSTTSAAIDRDEYLQGRGEGHVEQVPGRPLDAILASLDVEPETVAFVWSDTEGHEAAVLGSGDPLWSAGVPSWTELWPAGLEAHGGIAGFCEIVDERFASFVLGPELCAAGRQSRPRPVAELRRYLEGKLVDSPSWWSTDALLVPHR